MRLLLLSLLLLLTGCATSTIQSRRQEKLATYQSLPADVRELVDKGQIKVGMSADAVYIAWGAPSQTVHAEDQNGATTTWLYQGMYLEQYQYWNCREIRTRDGTFLERFLDTDYSPRSFLRAEINFANGVVTSWRTISGPPQ